MKFGTWNGFPSQVPISVSSYQGVAQFKLVTAFPFAPSFPCLLKHNRTIDSLPVQIHPWKYMFPQQKGSQMDAKPWRSLPGDDAGNVFQLFGLPSLFQKCIQNCAMPQFLTKRRVLRTECQCVPQLADPGHKALLSIFCVFFRSCRLQGPLPRAVGTFCHFLVQLRKYSLRLCSFQLGLKCGYETDVFFLHYQGYQHIWSLPVAPFFDSAYHFRVAAPVSWLSFFPFSVQ